MAVQSETLQVTGIRCERCVNRLAAALRGNEGLESANANLMGQVSLQFDDEKTTRDELVAVMAKAGFPRARDRLTRCSRRFGHGITAAPGAFQRP